MTRMDQALKALGSPLKSAIPWAWVFGAPLLLLACESALAGPLSASGAFVEVREAEQSRIATGAIMRVYHFIPKTLEVTPAESFLFRDLGTCDDSVEAALFAGRRATDGDLVDADCAALDPPSGSAEPEAKRLRSGLREL